MSSFLNVLFLFLISQAHLAATKGITHADMDELEAELGRLRKLKAEKLTDMIEAARDEIQTSLQVPLGSCQCCAIVRQLTSWPGLACLSWPAYPGLSCYVV